MARELQTAVDRLDVQISIIEMQLNSEKAKWPERKHWRALLKAANKVVEENEKRERLLNGNQD